MTTTVSLNIADAIYKLFQTLPNEQRISLLNKLNIEILSKKEIYGQEIIDARNMPESYLFIGDEFEKISKKMLNGEKIDLEQNKQTEN